MTVSEIRNPKAKGGFLWGSLCYPRISIPLGIDRVQTLAPIPQCLCTSAMRPGSRVLHAQCIVPRGRLRHPLRERVC